MDGGIKVRKIALISVGRDEYGVKIVALDGIDLSGENYVNAYII